MIQQPILRRLLVFSSLLGLIACQKDMTGVERDPELAAAAARNSPADQVNTFKGPQVTMGAGKARSFFSVNHEGVPQEIGMEMTSAAVLSMELLFPEQHTEFALPLHQKARTLTAFEHLVIDWNPGGHPPPGIFDVAHFDFHFYTITLAERLQIEFGPTEAVPDGYMPDGWISDPVDIEAMGTHWSDRSVAPGTFAATMIYGSYAGKMNFVEPMITLEELTTHNARNIDYPQPDIYGETGVWYPTDYNYYRVGDKYYVTLTDFVWSGTTE